MTAGLSILSHLPDVANGDLGLYLIGSRGEPIECIGIEERIEFEVREGALHVSASTQRVVCVHPVVKASEWIVITYDLAAKAVLCPFLETLLGALTEKEQVKLDMESMYSSSLALLEEVSMVGEMLPKLPTADSEIEVARMGLEALLVAASVERAIYIRLDEERALAEVLVHVRAADSGLSQSSNDYDGESFIPEDDGIVWRTMRGSGDAILKGVDVGGLLGASHLGAPGSPESLAERELIAVPVRYGAGESAVTLGVLLVMDKRPNAYSTTSHFGSQDTKLASSVAAMLGSVLGTRKVTELGKEMRTAQELHQQMLPSGAPRLAGFDLAGGSTSSGVVGGDYYDFLELPDGRLFCVIADVSGHNLASGLVMVSARATLRLLASTIEQTGSVFDLVGRSLFGDLSRTEQFITAAGVTIEGGTRAMEIVNAGHNPTMIYRHETDEVEEVYADDTVLGFLPKPSHAVMQRQLFPGDAVLLYTDGITEAVDEDGEFFGEERLREVLRTAAAGSAEQIVSAVFGAASAFADRTVKGDDVSVIVIKAT